jgi:hypothetical protein
MRHPIPTDEAGRTTRSLQQPSRPTSAEAPESGDRFLGPSGRFWTVQAITAHGNRIVLTTPTPEGDSGAIVDLVAIARMIPLRVATSPPDNAPATPGDRPARGRHIDATDDDPRTRAIPTGTAQGR